MRKPIASFMFFMLFSMFTGTVHAAKVKVCEAIKFDPEYKGLYGLCNAYWNEEDEEYRALILENWDRKVGPDGPGMPGLDESVPVVCPCWSEGEIDHGITPLDCEVGDDYMLAFYDDYDIQYGTGVLVGLGPDSCEYYNFDLGESMWATGLNTAELDACAADLMARLVDDFGGCGVPEP